MTTFDLYLLRRFLHTFVILFVTLFGLYVVIDGFTNVDGFQEGAESAVVVLRRMASYYGYQSSLLFDLMGPTVAVASVMVVSALLVKNSEYQPILAAGVPLARLAVPFVAGLLLVTAATVANQEFVIPRIAHKLQGPRSELKAVMQDVTPQIDYATGIVIEGASLDVENRRILGAEFILPQAGAGPGLVGVLTTLSAEEARYVPQTSKHPAGWVLTNTTPAKYHDLPLTPRGIEYVVPVRGTDEIFVRSDISFDLVCDNSRSATWQATPELVRRIRNPALSRHVARDQTFLLHRRLVQPLLNLFAGLACIPLVIRRESRSLVGSMALACGVQGLLLGALHGASFVGKAGFVAADVAAWLPVIVCGTIAAWVTGYAQT
ncbi:MAG TPA: LptF/LptG family permease [Planctomycetaceae bacterium]